MPNTKHPRGSHLDPDFESHNFLRRPTKLIEILSRKSVPNKSKRASTEVLPAIQKQRVKVVETERKQIKTEASP